MINQSSQKDGREKRLFFCDCQILANNEMEKSFFESLTKFIKISFDKFCEGKSSQQNHLTMTEEKITFFVVL